MTNFSEGHLEKVIKYIYNKDSIRWGNCAGLIFSLK